MPNTVYFSSDKPVKNYVLSKLTASCNIKVQQINVGACIGIALQGTQEKLLMSLLKEPGLEHKSQSAGNAIKLMDNEDG